MIKTEKEIEIMREGGKRLAKILDYIAEMVKPNINAKELNDKAEELIRKGGDEPSFLGYTPEGARRPYPATVCVSINDEIVHGIPNEEKKILKEGDIVGLDIGLKHKSLYLDTAITVGVGNINKEDQKLINITKQALQVGINIMRVGNTIGDIGYAIEQFVKPYKYGIPVELGGHSIGYKQAERPYIANFGEKGKGIKLKKGMTLAIEPMLNQGDSRIALADDDYTYKTADGKKSAHFEHTILITESKPEILTMFQK